MVNAFSGLIVRTGELEFFGRVGSRTRVPLCLF